MLKTRGTAVAVLLMHTQLGVKPARKKPQTVARQAAAATFLVDAPQQHAVGYAAIRAGTCSTMLRME
ncbi:hypothetical protein PG996_007409 [Apiospora saccharicola]|uniref:Secreted protein n=1 Tax=Apiospora saccharicola TaxID=335842 RepID=A0ABR1VAR8_9PEZI